MSRKALPASTFFQPLKPFSLLIWSIFFSVICLVSALVFIFYKVYNNGKMRFQNVPNISNFHDVFFHVSKIWKLKDLFPEESIIISFKIQMFGDILGHGHGLWTSGSLPRSSKYLIFIYSLFGCFMMNYFYSVSQEKTMTIAIICLSRAFSLGFLLLFLWRNLLILLMMCWRE